MDAAVLFVFWIVVGGLVGALIGKNRGRTEEGFALGAVLGFIGWLLVAAGPDKRRKCPACLQAVPTEAIKCCHCGSELPLVVSAVATQPAAGPTGAWEYREHVKCPVCGRENRASWEEVKNGLKCGACGVGFVPRPGKGKY